MRTQKRDYIPGNGVPQYNVVFLLLFSQSFLFPQSFLSTYGTNLIINKSFFSEKEGIDRCSNLSLRLSFYATLSFQCLFRNYHIHDTLDTLTTGEGLVGGIGERIRFFLPLTYLMSLSKHVGVSSSLRRSISGPLHY